MKTIKILLLFYFLPIYTLFHGKKYQFFSFKSSKKKTIFNKYFPKNKKFVPTIPKDILKDHYKTNLDVVEKEDEGENKSIEDISTELKLLIDDIAEDLQIPLEVLNLLNNNQWQEAQEILNNFINDKHITLDNICEIHYKSIRLSSDFFKKEIESKRNMIQLTNIIKSFDISGSINMNYTEYKNKNPRDIFWSKDNFNKINNYNFGATWDINKFLQYFGEIALMYINFLKIEMEKLEIENKLFSQLMNLLENYTQNKIQLIRLFMKINYIYIQLKYLISQKSNFNEEQILRQIQQFYKTMDKLIKYLESAQDYAMKIKKLSSHNIGNIFLIDTANTTNKFFTGKLDYEKTNKNIETFQTQLEDAKTFSQNNYQKLLNQIIVKNIEIKKSPTINFLNKIFINTGFDKNNIPSLIKKKQFINGFNTFIGIFDTKINHCFNLNIKNRDELQDQLQQVNYQIYNLNEKKNDHQKNKQNHMIKFFDMQIQETEQKKQSLEKQIKQMDFQTTLNLSISSTQILNGILESVNNYYQNKEEIFTIENKARNLFLDILQIVESITMTQEKIYYLNKKIEIYNKKIIQDEKKIGYTIKKQQWEDVLHKISTMKMKLLIEINGLQWKSINFNYIYGYIKTKKNLNQL